MYTVTVGVLPIGVDVNLATNGIYMANFFTNETYVANRVSDNVSVIDGITNTVTATVTVGTFPQGVGVNP